VPEFNAKRSFSGRTSGCRRQRRLRSNTSVRRQPVWKTVAIGTSKGVDAVRAAMDAAPSDCIALGDEILGRPSFPFSRADRA
jgi:hypothetical protein